MMALTLVDVVGRYFFDSPVVGATEYISFLLAIVMYAGLPLVTRDNGHISVGILTNHFPAWLKKAESALTIFVTFTMTAFIAFITLQQAEILRAEQAITEDLGLKVAPITYILGLFAVATALYAFKQTVSCFRKIFRKSD